VIRPESLPAQNLRATLFYRFDVVVITSNNVVLTSCASCRRLQ